MNKVKDVGVPAPSQNKTRFDSSKLRFFVLTQLGILDLVNDPSLLGLDLKQSGLKKEFDLISTGFNELDLLLGKGWDYKFQATQDPMHFYFVLNLSFQVLYQSVRQALPCRTAVLRLGFKRRALAGPN